jgi:hypothetical protein
MQLLIPVDAEQPLVIAIMALEQKEHMQPSVAELLSVFGHFFQPFR